MCNWFVLLALLTFAQPLFSQQTGEYAKEIEVFEEFVRKQMEIDRIPGLSIGFIKDDFMWTRGFGYADLENKVPATAKSAYRLASITKSMTAAAILCLTEKGKIDPDAEVQTYVPYFPRQRWPVTVRQLLGHLGGINYGLVVHQKEYMDTKESLATTDFVLIAQPGTKYRYSNYGFNLLGAVIEGAAKQSYGTYLRENLWEPFGMSDTNMDDPDELFPNRVRGYRLMDGELKNSKYINISNYFAAGGTRTTIVDLLKYAKGLNSEKVLSSESIELMYTSMATKDGHFTDYGMGWHIDPVNGRFSVNHTGGQPETRTILIRFPKENFAVALAYNLEGGDLYAYPHRLARLILDEPWNMALYTGSKVDDALYNGIRDAYNFGLSYFKRYQKPLTQDQKELAEAFAYFNNYVNRDSLLSDYKGIGKKISDGRHPVAGEAFVKIGSYMAAKLMEEFGSQHIELYHKMGALTFFNDYMEICNQSPDHPKELQFSEQCEEIIAEWDAAWLKTYSEYVIRLSLTPFSDLDAIGRKLKKTFSGAEIYPDLSEEFAKVTRHFYINGEREKALKTASLSLELYPQSVVPCVFLANAYVCSGEKDKAQSCYRKALKINPDDPAISAERLNRYARDLADFSKWEEAMALLKVAVQVYPEEAGLYSSIADIHLKRGKDYYQKALEMDPTFEPARKELKKIR